jgi:CheY-like chemotaxis protein
MPGFSGFDIFRELKKDDLLKSNNVLIFTASSVTDQELKDMLSSGAKGVLKKPLSIDDLIQAIAPSLCDVSVKQHFLLGFNIPT